MEQRASELDILQEQLRTTWPTINAARSRAAEMRGRLEAALAPLTTHDTSIVVFGSLAREEFTAGSDIDWTLLIDGEADPQHWDFANEIRRTVEKEFTGPGREATFGGLASSHDLLHKIGGGDDTNRNTTQRILLLLESAVIGREEAHNRVTRCVLQRYILEDFGWQQSITSPTVPRFLLNDIARYWRTVAVDFAYKRRERSAEGWALRTAKLRLSRKLTYAAGLVACFECSFLGERYAEYGELDLDARAHVVVNELGSFLRKTPLEILATAFLRFNAGEAAANLFRSYDEFLTILGDQRREQLKALQPDSAAHDELFQHVREIGHRFQDALNELFLPSKGGYYYELTRTYGVF